MPNQNDQPAESRTAATAEGFRFKNLFADVAIYSSGNLLVKGLSLISAPIFTRLFTPDQYGAWSFVNVCVAFLTGVLLLGGDNAYTRFFFLCKSEQEKKTLTATWFSFLAIWSLIVTAAVIPFSGQLAQWLLGDDRFRAAFAIGLISSPLAVINLILAQALRNRFQARAYALFNLTTAILTIALAVFFVLAFELGIAGVLLGAVVVSLLMIPFRLWSVRDLLSCSFSVKLLKQLLRFGLPLVPMSIAFWLFSNADRMMLARLASLDAVGLYSIAGSMAAIIMLLQTAVGQSWLPHGVKLFEEDRAMAAVVFRRTMVYLLAGSGLVITAFVALAQEVLFLLVPPTYYAAFWPIPFLAAGFIFFTSAHVSVVSIMVNNKTLYVMLACWTIAALNIGFNALLIPRFGLIGAGAATGFAYLLFAASYALISQRLWRIDYPGQTIAALYAIPLTAIALIALIAYFGPGVAINLLLKLLVVALCAAGLLYVVARHDGSPFSEPLRLLWQTMTRKGA